MRDDATTFTFLRSRPQYQPALFLMALCVLCDLAGCANHLDIEAQALHNVDRKTTLASIDISGPTSLPLTTPYLEVTATEHKKCHVIEYDGTARYDVYTPYQGWRKAYEIPEGLFLLPVAIIASIVPSSQTPELLDWSISGINPFLNIEDKSRSERKLLDKNLAPYDERDEYSAIPLSGATLVVHAYNQVDHLTLDENGKARINLLDYYRDDTTDNAIELTISGDGVSKIEEWLVAGNLNKTLKQAKIISNKLQDLITGTNAKTSRAQLADMAVDINTLSDMGFVYDAKQLRKKIASHLDDQEKIEFAGLLAVWHE
jgi:hypothetical protein